MVSRSEVELMQGEVLALSLIVNRLLNQSGLAPWLGETLKEHKESMPFIISGRVEEGYDRMMRTLGAVS